MRNHSMILRTKSYCKEKVHHQYTDCFTHLTKHGLFCFCCCFDDGSDFNPIPRTKYDRKLKVYQALQIYSNQLQN